MGGMGRFRCRVFDLRGKRTVYQETSPHGDQNQRTEDMPCILATRHYQLPGRVIPMVTNAINRLSLRPSSPFSASRCPLMTQTLDIKQSMELCSIFVADAQGATRIALSLGGCRLLSSLGLLGGLLLCGLLLLGSIGGSGLGLTVVGRSPQGEVVPEQLHDKGAVTVGLLGERVELSNGIIEGLLGEVAGTIR